MSAVLPATRGEQWAAAARTGAAMLAVAAITVAASVETLGVGPAAAGLLYLLPVLWVSASAGLTAGLTSAGLAAFCYNFFLLEPRHTLRIHGLNDIAAFAVLAVVAVVTSRLAAGLRASELEAREQAAASEAEAAFTALLARATEASELDAAALGELRARFGEALLLRADDLREKTSGLAPLDAAAAAWALHHGAASGQGAEVMPAADFRFVPLGAQVSDVLALGGRGRFDARRGRHAEALARLWAQARDRLSAQGERHAREEAEAREGVRRTLLAALGHDFRTPLTILKSGLAEVEGEAAARLGAEVDRLARLSDNLVEAARLENGAAARLEPVDLVDAIAAARPPAAVDGPNIRVALPDDLPLVRADATMLAHCLRNLLENGVRHARAVVEVSAELTAKRTAAPRVRVQVRDDGAGVDPAIAEALFDPFVTGGDRQGGSGLGLTLARDLARAMGGTLTADDAAEGGACFTLTLDALPPREEAR